MNVKQTSIDLLKLAGIGCAVALTMAVIVVHGALLPVRIGSKLAEVAGDKLRERCR